MNDGFLSQEEIDSLLEKNNNVNDDTELTEEEKDLLGEVGNISMATAATTLSTLLSRTVKITTPKVEMTTLRKLQNNLTIPNVVLQVKFESGLQGTNVLLINIKDASIIADLIMGGDGKNPNEELSEIELSAVSEAMNQMIGSASTSMSTMMGKPINIDPPNTQIWDSQEEIVVEDIEPEQNLIKTAFRMTVDDLIDSEIMQVFTMDTVEDISSTMMGTNKNVEEAKEENVDEIPEEPLEQELMKEDIIQEEKVFSFQEEVQVKKPKFSNLQDTSQGDKPKNIDLIMDVPLEFSVVLGKTNKTIKEVLSLGPGSVVELNKFAEEPLEIYVNGKLIAQGEVVVINENFGIRITNILSATERVHKLK